MTSYLRWRPSGTVSQVEWWTTIVTMGPPISLVVEHFKNKGWSAKALLDLCGMYVTAFRHGWFLCQDAAITKKHRHD